MATQTLIEAQTDAVSTQAPFQVTRDNLPVTLMAVGLAGSEECDLYFSHDEGTTWTLLRDKDGNVLKLTATVTSLAIDSPILLGVTKDASVGAAGVYVDKGV